MKVFFFWFFLIDYVFPLFVNAPSPYRFVCGAIDRLWVNINRLTHLPHGVSVA